MEKLKSYKALLDEGVITQDEFETIRKAILSDSSRVNHSESTEKNIFDNIKQT
ncbi:SHOCT domain-containing protein [Weissella bombi]|uniref:SHOCT domain-containing protein n=1 Tax=Weissella bombi TaxID=1505725 RepID=UPI003AF2E744